MQESFNYNGNGNAKATKPDQSCLCRSCSVCVVYKPLKANAMKAMPEFTLIENNLKFLENSPQIDGSIIESFQLGQN